jgi:putative FmdB family regulatory protein
MPIYEYECTNCGHRVEIMQKFSDPPIEECERCHGKMKKLISQCTFHLKGTGWYVTDYGSKAKQKDKDNGAKSEKKTQDKDKKE